jgi:hypothetical protein
MIRTKLALSHALAQSVKISLFEELISSTIEQTKDIPKSLSETGKIGVRPSIPPADLHWRCCSCGRDDRIDTDLAVAQERNHEADR